MCGVINVLIMIVVWFCFLAAGAVAGCGCAVGGRYRNLHKCRGVYLKCRNG